MTIPVGRASIPPKPPINSLCPVQVGVHTITVIVSDYWFVPGAHQWVNGEYAVEGEPFPGIFYANEKGEKKPVLSWWAHTTTCSVPMSGSWQVIKKWKITWHAPQIDGLMDEKALISQYIQILNKMNAPEYLINLELQGYGIARVVAIDIARDFDGVSGAREPTPAESRWHRRHHMIDIQKVCIPDFSEGETFLSAPETIYIQSPKRGVVECRYDKGRHLRQQYGVLLPNPRSRVEIRYKGGQTCKRNGIQTLPQACRCIREMRLIIKEERRRENKNFLAELRAWRKEISKLCRKKNENCAIKGKKEDHIVYSFTARLLFLRIRSKAKRKGGASHAHPHLLPVFHQIRGPPNSSFSTNYYAISARPNNGVLLLFCVPGEHQKGLPRFLELKKSLLSSSSSISFSGCRE